MQIFFCVGGVFCCSDKEVADGGEAVGIPDGYRCSCRRAGVYWSRFGDACRRFVGRGERFDRVGVVVRRRRVHEPVDGLSPFQSG